MVFLLQQLELSLPQLSIIYNSSFLPFPVSLHSLLWWTYERSEPGGHIKQKAGNAERFFNTPMLTTFKVFLFFRIFFKIVNIRVDPVSWTGDISFFHGYILFKFYRNPPALPPELNLIFHPLLFMVYELRTISEHNLYFLISMLLHVISLVFVSPLLSFALLTVHTKFNTQLKYHSLKPSHTPLRHVSFSCLVPLHCAHPQTVLFVLHWKHGFINLSNQVEYLKG